MKLTIRKCITIFFALFCIIDNLKAANVAQDTIKAYTYFNRAESLLSTDSYDSAWAYFEKAAEEYLYNEIWDRYLFTTYERSYLLRSINNQNKEVIDRLLDNINQIPIRDSSFRVMSLKADIYLNIAYAYRGLGKYKEAIENFDKVLLLVKNVKKEIEEVAITGKAVTYWYLGDYESALTLQESALKILESTKNSQAPRLQVANNILGLIHVGLGNYQKAIEHYEKAMRLLETSEEKNLRSIASINTNLGIVQKIIGHKQKAIQHFDVAYRIFTENDLSKASIATVLIQIGQVYLELEQYDEALNYFNQSLKIGLQFSEKDHPVIAQSYSHLAEIYKLIGEFNLSHEHYEKTLKIRLNNAGESSHILSYTYNRLADLFMKQGLYNQALETLNKALLSNVKRSKGNPEHYSLSKQFKNSLSKLEFLETLELRASVFRSIYEKNQEIDYLISALETYELYDSFRLEIQSYHQKYADKAELSQSFAELYHDAIALCKQLFENTNKKKYVAKAFFFSERRKANILYSNISDVSAKKFAGIPDSLLSKEKQLKIDLSFYKSQELHELVKTEYDTIKLNYVREKVFSLSRKQEDLIRLFENNYPKYFSNKYNVKTASINEIQKLILKENQVMVAYFLERNSLYIFTVSEMSCYIEEVKIDSSFHSHFDQFRSGLSSQRLTKQTLENFNSYANSAYYLYQKLLAPIENYIKRKDLIIVPDDKLALIPFEALLTKNMHQAVIDYKSLPYLLKSYSVTYANSATNLLNSLKSSGSNKEILAFAPSFDNESASNKPDTVRSSLGSLGWTQKEVSSIGTHFDGVNYLGAEATEKRFKEYADQYGIIHIASHSLVDDQNPMYSKIAFTLDASDTLNDGYLHTFELYNTQLNADMAVLSACNTGYGKVLKGEGVMSLGYAFAYAGVPSIVMSHWQVDDKSTYLLMDKFYQYLSEGMNKSRALKKAKLDLLEDENVAYANPYYWSAFVVYGDDSPVTTKSIRWTWYVAPLFALLLCALIYVKIRKAN